MAEAVFESILQAVRQQIFEIVLPGLPDENVQVVKLYRNRGTVEPGLPGVLVFPSGVETITPTTNASDDIGYPVAVAMLAEDRNDGTQDQEQNRDRLLLWREKVRDHFIGQRLTGVVTVWNCIVEPNVIVDQPEWANNVWRGALVLRFVSRERRGRNVANITE